MIRRRLGPEQRMNYSHREHEWVRSQHGKEYSKRNPENQHRRRRSGNSGAMTYIAVNMMRFRLIQKTHL